MLPLLHRLPASLILTVLRTGKKLEVDQLRLVYRISPTKSYRFAIVVPLKIAKLAVERNRSKRVLRDGIRRIFSTNTWPIEAVLFAKVNLSSYTQKQVDSFLLNLARKLQTSL